MTARNRNPSRPYRVVVWGTGKLGAGVLREAIRLPEFELVGVLVFTPEKAGIDAGTMVGMPPTGVITTLDKEKIFALEADCVLHSPRHLGDWQQEEDIIRLLESGTSVVTSHPYHWPAAIRQKSEIERLEAACRKGGASLHATGIDPGFAVERLTLTATGISNSIQSIRMQEVNECSLLNHDQLSLFGFGHPVDNVPNKELASRMADMYLRPSVAFAGDRLGVAFDRIGHEAIYRPTDRDIELDGFTYARGTVACIQHCWTGVVAGKPFFSLEINWYLSEAMKPVPTPSEDCWIITIEGRPSVQLTLDVRPSFAQPELRLYPGDPTIPSYYATAVPMTQAVPLVCNATVPGILYPTLFGRPLG